MYSKDVSFITVNYNGLKDTLELLSSIDGMSNVSFKYEVIVVDNASVSNPRAEILSKFPQVKVILSSENLGFAGGNNLGIQSAEGEFLFFINNDTIVSDGLVELMLKRFREIDNLGMLSPKIKFYKTNIIQYAGFSPLNIFSRNFAYGNQEKDGEDFQNFIPTYSGHGAAMMVPRRVIEKVGQMPEMYFLYYEELDWSQQILRAGFKVMVEQKAEIYHKESMTVGKNSSFKAYYLYRNRILFVRRNFKGLRKIIGLTYLYFVISSVKLFHTLLSRNRQHFRACYNAIIWNLKTSKHE
jgi:GT2 family glycosyltransferase